MAPKAERKNARPQADDPPRSWLRHAARSVRAAGAEPAATSESPWDHVVSGRWSVVDSFEEGGTLFVIAQKNSAAVCEARALTDREREVLSRAARGSSNKCIAYDLKISQSHVSLTMSRTREKVRLHSAAELARLLWVLQAAECDQLKTITDYWTIDRQQYVTFSRGQPLTATLETLTPSERMVFEAVIAGLSTAEIIALRGGAPRTLANQLACIFRKLRIGSRAELRVQFAYCYRQTEPPKPRPARSDQTG